PITSLGLEEFELSEKELNIGSELVKRLTVKFQPQKYHNDHVMKLRALIDKKAHGEKIVLFRPRHLKPTASGNLLKVLEESLKKAA
ncbi:MAG: hypothetical protein PHC61_10475, partial [Chitinivibrionales bacterium]|nr:hypothetical protein [Chitinivibrionales bacterium]